MDRLKSVYGDFLRSDILKFYHSLRFSNKSDIAKKFFEGVAPKVYIITGGKKFTFRPSGNAINSITLLDSKCYKTISNGAIDLFIETYSFKVEPFLE